MDLDRLFNKAKSGDTEAEKELFSILLVRFRLIASHIIGNHDVSHDVAHDAVVSVLENYRELEVHTSFMAWAQSIIRRQALRYIRERKRELNMSREMGNRMNANPHYDIAPLFERKIIDCLKELYAIEKRFPRVLNLKHLGFTFEEICDKLNIKHNNAYVLLHRARKALLSCLQRKDKRL